MRIRPKLSPFSQSFFLGLALIVLFLVSSNGCRQPTPNVPDTTRITTLFLLPTKTSTSIPKTTSNPTPRPTLTETPAYSVTPPFLAISLALQAEWQLKYKGEASWSPDSKYLVVTDDNSYGLDDQTQMYDVNTLESVWLTNVGMPSPTFSPDGKFIVTSGTILEFWDASTGKLIDAPYEGNAILSTAFIPGKNTLLVGRSWVLGFGVDTANSEIGVWDYKQKSLNIIFHHDGDITAFIVNPDGRLLGTAFSLLPDIEGGSGIFLWDMVNKSIRCTFRGEDPAFNPAGNIIAVADNSLAGKGNVSLYDTDTCQLLKTLYQAEYIDTLAYSPDGQVLALVSKPENTIRLLNAVTGVILFEQRGDWDTVWQLAFSPNGRFLMSHESYGTKHKIHIWMVRTAHNQ